MPPNPLTKRKKDEDVPLTKEELAAKILYEAAIALKRSFTHYTSTWFRLEHDAIAKLEELLGVNFLVWNERMSRNLAVSLGEM